MYICDPEKIRDGISFKLVQKYLKIHKKELPRLERLEDYYNGVHSILHRGKDEGQPNNRLVCNHAKYITDMATGYLVGNPVSYEGDGADSLKEWYKKADAPTQDMDLSKDASVYGKAFELVYFSSDQYPICKLANLNPKNAFLVYDNTVEHLELFGVYYFPDFDDDGKTIGYKCNVYDNNSIISYLLDRDMNPKGEPEVTPHHFGRVPMTEYYNNEECQGDFEQVISLIDAYNLLQSDRVNDKEQFVDSILLLLNSSLGDDAKEESEALKALKRERVLELHDNGDARWLTRTFDESSVEILRKAIEQDIHKFSNVPCMTDENFVGNSSGVAMRYKMLGFEQVTRIKERYFTEGLKRRIVLFENAMEKKGVPRFDPSVINITFTRNLPVNETEIASMVAQLSGQVPAEILLAQLPFIKDAEAAVHQMAREKADNLKRQQTAFGYTGLTNE